MPNLLTALHRLTLTCAMLLAAGNAGAHEFWIEPEAWQIAPGDAVVARLRNGTEFEGAELSYLPQRFERFDLIQGDAVVPVEGRLGDRPALDMVPPAEGLLVVAHVTTTFDLTYDAWDRFLAFAQHKDFADIAARHDARGLPRTGFGEEYVRYARSLLAVGDGAGADRPLGLVTEIVALANPYTDDVSAGMPVQVLLRGAPRADAQVELFDRAPDGTVAITYHRTDAEGRVTLPVTPGHDYLVDAVVLEPVEGGEVAWRTLWASTTFGVLEDGAPGR